MRAPAAALAAFVLAAGGCGIDDGVAVEPPGSTLEATIGDPDGDGELDRGPGEELVDRTELAPRGDADRTVARFGQLTDPQVTDEESPARVPFLDRLGDPVTEAFRPQEALTTQVLSAAIRAMNAGRPEALLITGDLVDSAQRNELDAFLTVVSGGTVEPDSGDAGYDGVQSADNPDGYFYRPELDAPRIPSLLRRASQPFFAPGVRAPWYPAIGNHDLLVQGEQPPSAATDAIATGDRALLTFDPELADRLDATIDPGDRSPTLDLGGLPRNAIEDLLADGVPSDDATEVPADPARRAMPADELIDDLERASGVRGRGDRLDYVADLSPRLRAIVLDTATRTGGRRGTLEPGQVAFLRRALDRAGDRSIVVVDHHGLERVDGGEAALALLDDDPRVVAELRGDRHRNEIRPVRTRAGGYWRITTASLADWPQQGRMLRLVSGPGGQRALETWMVDHAGGVSTRELSGASRQLAYDDAQGGRPARRAGRRTDRNARLWLPPRR